MVEQLPVPTATPRKSQVQCDTLNPSSVGAGGYGCQGHSQLYTKFESENLSQENEIVTSTQAVVDTLIRLKTKCYLSNFFLNRD